MIEARSAQTQMEIQNLEYFNVYISAHNQTRWTIKQRPPFVAEAGGSLLLGQAVVSTDIPHILCSSSPLFSLKMTIFANKGNSAFMMLKSWIEMISYKEGWG